MKVSLIAIISSTESVIVLLEKKRYPMKILSSESFLIIIPNAMLTASQNCTLYKVDVFSFNTDPTNISRRLFQ